MSYGLVFYKMLIFEMLHRQENVKKAFYSSFRSRCRSRRLCLSALLPQTAGPGNVKLKI